MVNNKIKSILFVIRQMNIAAGTERVVSNLANYFVNSGIHIKIVVINHHNYSCYQLDKRIKILPLGLSNEYKGKISYIYNLIQIFFRLYKIINNLSSTIIIGTSTDINNILAIHKLLNKKLFFIGTEHFHIPTAIQGRLDCILRKVLYKYLDIIVLLTKATENWLLDNIKIKKSAVIPNHLVYPLISIEPNIHPKNIIDLKKNTLLAIGRLTFQKGFDLLIPVFKNILKKYKNWQLVILGDGADRVNLEKQINQLELKNKVFLPGAVGNLANWYQTADMFVFSSRYEGFGCALVEAMSYGLPAVSFDCKSGPADIIRHGVDGLLVEDGNTEKLEQALAKLMIDEKLRQQFAANAITVRERFSIENIAIKWNSLFAELRN